MSSPVPRDEQAFAQWHQTQQQRVADYLRRLQVFDTDITGEWQWIIPHRGMIGQVHPKEGSSPVLWVITGIVPTDHVEASAAKNCREAARYFALKWQLEAARLSKGAEPTATDEDDDGKIDWNETRDHITRRVEWLYDLMNDDRRWKPDGLPVMRIDFPSAQA